jgi:hypothetical protein
MIWPPSPTCHSRDGQPDTAFVWAEPARAREPYGEAFRTCNYCGSIHPGDLYDYLTNPLLTVTMGGSDWKYGWPHKFYIDGIPNLHPPERLVWMGTEYIDGVKAPMMRPAPPHVFTKFYTRHLLDKGYGNGELAGLLFLLSKHTGIEWSINDEGNIIYRAPFYGYQR